MVKDDQNKYHNFVDAHKEQLEALNIPPELYRGLHDQLEATFRVVLPNSNDNKDEDDDEINNNNNKSFPIRKCLEGSCSSSTSSSVVEVSPQIRSALFEQPVSSSTDCRAQAQQRLGSLVVLPHICCWDILHPHHHRGLLDELEKLSDSVLQDIWDGLKQAKEQQQQQQQQQQENNNNHKQNEKQEKDTPSSTNCRRETLLDNILRLGNVWLHVILYSSSNNDNNSSSTIRAALPAPPYFPQLALQHPNDTTEADLTGPFPFEYHHYSSSTSTPTVIETSLAYISPDYYVRQQTLKQQLLQQQQQQRLPTMDCVPFYTCCGNIGLRSVRLAALLLGSSGVGNSNSSCCCDSTPTTCFAVKHVKQVYMDMVHQMELYKIRQQQQQQNKLLDEEKEQQQRQQQQHPPTQQRKEEPVAENETIPTTTTTTPTTIDANRSSSSSGSSADRAAAAAGTVWKVYTDSNDPMALGHPEAGLTDPHFELTTSLEEADIIYSYHSLFSPSFKSILDKKRQQQQQQLEQQQQQQQQNQNQQQQSPVSSSCFFFLMNQFPYEGAFVQKDHLAREILKQHGLPRPAWSIESYDLDVQLAEFIGAAVVASEQATVKEEQQQQQEEKEEAASKQQSPPLWIVKPARGTQSKGHLVTSSTAHILKLLDASSAAAAAAATAGAGATFRMSRVAQRYIDRPVCVQGHKTDCRCIVIMKPPSSTSQLKTTTSTTTSSSSSSSPSEPSNNNNNNNTNGSTNNTNNNNGNNSTSRVSLLLPELYMHNRVYFRIAHKVHSIRSARDWTDQESVLTATHLFDASNRSSSNNNNTSDNATAGDNSNKHDDESKDNNNNNKHNNGEHENKQQQQEQDALRTLPVDTKTIAMLEEEYGTVGFDWKGIILPKIQTMIRELFNGMTRAYPAMLESKESRALYGVDIMFEIITTTTTTTTTATAVGGKTKTKTSIEPKLTEVTFCPANNAICDAYERDEDLYRSYNNDIFNCMFLDKVSKNITRLQ